MTSTSSAAANDSSGPATSTTLPARGSRRSMASKRSSRPAPGSPTSVVVTGRRRCCSRETYPASTVVGFDAHDGSIDAARKRAADAGLVDRVRFEVASATTFAGTYDLVCFFDCLHDMGDPAGACAHVRDQPRTRRDAHAHRALRRTTTWPTTSTRSAPPTTGSRPCSAPRARCPKRSAPRSALRPARRVCGRSSTAAGFKTFRRVAETPFNIVLEAKA